VLEGSVRKGGNRVRVTVQLVDAETGMHLSADRFDGPLEDSFDFQDQVASGVAGVMQRLLGLASLVDRHTLVTLPNRHIGDPDQLSPRVTSSTTAPVAPPTKACFLLDLFLSKADRETITGDLEELFRSRLVKYGPAGARLWFWGETVRVIATRNPVCRWLLVGGLTRLGEWIFRQIGS
jgi:hypothetical protein